MNEFEVCPRCETATENLHEEDGLCTKCEEEWTEECLKTKTRWTNEYLLIDKITIRRGHWYFSEEDARRSVTALKGEQYLGTVKVVIPEDHMWYA